MILTSNLTFGSWDAAIAGDLDYLVDLTTHGPIPENRSGAIRVMYPGMLRIEAGGKSAFGPR
jgi:hypothetical protein